MPSVWTDGGALGNPRWEAWRWTRPAGGPPRRSALDRCLATAARALGSRISERKRHHHIVSAVTSSQAQQRVVRWGPLGPTACGTPACGTLGTWLPPPNDPDETDHGIRAAASGEASEADLRDWIIARCG